MLTSELTAAEKVIPVVVVDNATEGAHVGEALLAGGIHTAEVTFRTAGAEAAIREMVKISGLTVGAGTVINKEQAHRAIDAGATYVVSPGYSDDVIDVCQEAGIPVIPACTDGSWIMRAIARGIDIVKFFPAEAMGGTSAIKALSAPFPQIGFIPTGGVNKANLAEYLAIPAVKACGGSWMVKKDLIKNGSWERISALSREAVEIAKDITR